jgi:hypothetical protein
VPQMIRPFKGTGGICGVMNTVTNIVAVGLNEDRPEHVSKAGQKHGPKVANLRGFSTTPFGAESCQLVESCFVHLVVFTSFAHSPSTTTTTNVLSSGWLSCVLLCALAHHGGGGSADDPQGDV